MNPLFTETFSALKNILKAHEKELIVKTDNDESYYLNHAKNPAKPSEEGFFGAAQMKKNYVSFHLMPVYVYPELLESVSPALKKKMQGKSCFNFKKPEPELFDELRELTTTCFEKYREKNLL